MKRFFNFLIVAMLPLLFFFSCKKKVEKDRWTDTLRSGIVRIASDENLKVMIDAQVTSFEAYHNYQAIVVPIYATENEAIRLLIEDSVRLAIATRDLNAEEKADLEARNMYLKKFIIAFDGIALIANQMNPDSILGIPTIKKILTGEITEWSQINPKTSLGSIRLLFDNKDSGILRYMADSVAGRSSISGNLYALNNTSEVMGKVAEMPNAIGLVGASVLSEEAGPEYRKLKKDIRIFRISHEDKPTLENSYLPYAGDIIQENYPFWRPIYTLLTDPRSGISSGFTIFLSQEIGQKIILKSGLLPISGPNVRDVRILDVPLDQDIKTRTIN